MVGLEKMAETTRVWQSIATHRSVYDNKTPKLRLIKLEDGIVGIFVPVGLLCSNCRKEKKMPLEIKVSNHELIERIG